MAWIPVPDRVEDRLCAGMTTFYETINVDKFVKSRRNSSYVIPAKAGIQYFKVVIILLDPGFRRGDDFLRVHQRSLSKVY